MNHFIVRQIKEDIRICCMYAEEAISELQSLKLSDHEADEAAELLINLSMIKKRARFLSEGVCKTMDTKKG